jgi:hypothetical protein
MRSSMFIRGLEVVVTRIGKWATSIGVTSLAFASVLGVGTAASAAPPIGISGQFQEIGPDNFISVNPTPDFLYIGYDVHPIVFTGSLTGTSSSLEHTAERPNFTFETHNIETFSDVVVRDTSGNRVGEGGLVINFNATGYFTLNQDGSLGGALKGVWQIVSSSGGLAGLQGSGKVTGAPGSTTGYGTYAGTVHW